MNDHHKLPKTQKINTWIDFDEQINPECEVSVLEIKYNTLQKVFSSNDQTKIFDCLKAFVVATRNANPSLNSNPFGVKSEDQVTFEILGD